MPLLNVFSNSERDRFVIFLMRTERIRIVFNHAEDSTIVFRNLTHGGRQFLMEVSNQAHETLATSILQALEGTDLAIGNKEIMRQYKAHCVGMRLKR